MLTAFCNTNLDVLLEMRIFADMRKKEELWRQRYLILHKGIS